MGISGLLPYLKGAARQTNIKEFKGCTVAVDSYCWLHRGTFSCADKLVLGEQTDQYVYYCMKYVRNLLSMGIRPIMVFDGCSLPSKKEVEKQRRERRELNKKKAAELLREGRRSEARDAFRLCIDITSEMALNLMKACRDIGVDCIVAPYEADAQLAYLNKIGIAQVIITEDSDLLLFGCERVMFKMDIAGNGVLVEKNCINKALGLKADCYSFERFRYICILSGCDYLASLPGIGLKKATLIFQRTRQPDMNVVIKKIPTTLNMKSLTVTPAYIEGFFRANNTFLHQLVFDPTKRRLVPLNPYPEGNDQSDFIYAGPYLPEDLALQLAFGNLSVYNMEKIYDFDPDHFQPKSRPKYSKDSKDMLHCLSIWDRNYRPPPRMSQFSQKSTEVERSSTLGKEVTVDVKTGKVEQPDVKSGHVNQANVKHRSPVKRYREEEDLNEEDLLRLYASPSDSSQVAKKRKSDTNLEQKNSVEDNQVLNDLSELLHEAENATETLENGAQNGEFCGDMDTSVESPKLNDNTEVKKRRSINKFKVTKEVSRSRLDLNIKSDIKVEVTSRYFSASKTTKKATFLDSMQEKENMPEKESPIASSISHSSLVENQTTETVKGQRHEQKTNLSHNKASPSSVKAFKNHEEASTNSTTDCTSNDTAFINSEKVCTNSDKGSMDARANSKAKSPYRLFSFKSKMSNFKSDFDSKSLSSSKSSLKKYQKGNETKDNVQSLCSENTSQSVIELSSESDSVSSVNYDNSSQAGSAEGSIDQDSFCFTQNASQESVDDSLLSQTSDNLMSRSLSQGGGMSFTQNRLKKKSLDSDEKIDGSTKGKPHFDLDGCLGDEREEGVDVLKTYSENSPSNNQNCLTSSGCRTLGLSKSANSTPLTESSIKKTLGGSCRSSGLKRRPVSNPNSENSQTSIKNYFSKYFAYNKGNKDILEKRKPLSPTKVNVMNTA